MDDTTLGDTVRVLVKTSQGDVEFELDHKNAPMSVTNFLVYAKEGFYNDTIFHRVIKGFMVQGGGMDKNLTNKPTHGTIKNEANNGLLNKRGTISMARTMEVDSATSQFFINLQDNAFLDNGVRDFGYAVFGRVVKGMEIVDKISETPTGNQGGSSDVPKEAIFILSVEVIK